MLEGVGESFAAAPLIAGGRAIGGIFFDSTEPRRYEDRLRLIVSLARQAAQALDRAQLFERERASAGRLVKLQAVTAALSQAVTLEDVSRTCLEHAVTGIGAAEGLVVLRGAESTPDAGTLSVTASSGLEEAGDRIPDSASAPIAAAIRTGRPASSADGWLALSLASGALAVRRQSGLPLSEADREWLVTLVSQGAQALDRAGRYETERAIAETMQRSVLPERLPEIGGITLAARYLPGTIGVDVGGDWYDVIQLENGRIGLVVGDVVGKGVQAAAMMGQLRNALRAFAFEHDEPHEVVSRLDKLVEGTIEAAFATLAYLVVDPHERRVSYVVAGHPPPLIRAPDGTTIVPRRGALAADRRRRLARVRGGRGRARPGSTILLYTDGLVERHGVPLDEGLGLLAESAASVDDDPEELVDGVLAALIGDNERPDDIAVLAIRFATLRDRRPPARAPVVPGGARRDAGRPPLVALARERRRRGGAEAVLAVWEACANAVEHAQAPSAVVVPARGPARRRGPDARRGARHGTVEGGGGLGRPRARARV